MILAAIFLWFVFGFIDFLLVRRIIRNIDKLFPGIPYDAEMTRLLVSWQIVAFLVGPIGIIPSLIVLKDLA